MLRLGRPVGAFPGLEARLAAIRLGRRDEEAAQEEEERTGCHECGGMGEKAEPKPCSDAEKGAEEAGGNEGDCGCSGSDGSYDSDKGDTTDDESDCGCSEDTGKAWDKSCWNHEFALDY